MSEPFIESKHGKIIAFAIALCQQATWILEINEEATSENDLMIWHKLRHKNMTVCGGRVFRQPETQTANNIEPPPEEDQCIVCKYELSHLTLIEGGHKYRPKLPEPPEGPPEPPYTPNPPAAALEIPMAIAA